MPLVVIPSSYRFGVPDNLPEIPGFRIIAAEGEWLRAENAGRFYIVQETPSAWILESLAMDGERRGGITQLDGEITIEVLKP